MSEEADKPKLIVDEDWKSQAQAEKEKLAEQEKAKAEAGEGKPGELPEADFRGLVGTLASQAVMYLGGVPDPKTGQGMFEPVYAAFLIDLLSVLKEKTEGNLDEEEAKELEAVSTELRNRYVQIAQMVAAQQAQAGAGGGIPGVEGAGPQAGGPGVITP